MGLSELFARDDVAYIYFDIDGSVIALTDNDRNTEAFRWLESLGLRRNTYSVQKLCELLEAPVPTRKACPHIAVEGNLML